MYLSPEQLSTVTRHLTPEPAVTSLLEQGSGEMNEDELLSCLGTGVFGVFDGATSLSRQRFKDGLTGGRLAAECCLQAFSGDNGSLVQRAEQANTLIRESGISYGVDNTRKEELWAASCAVVRLRNNAIEWCQIGDCSILLVHRDNSFSLLSHDPRHDVDTLLKWQNESRRRNGEILRVMADEILRVRRRANLDYGVLNGEEAALGFLRGGVESLDDVRSILLFSDGLMLPQADPSASPDVAKFVELYCDDGLEGVLRYVRNKQLEDLDCTRYPRFKIHDDISAIALEFGR